MPAQEASLFRISHISPFSMKPYAKIPALGGYSDRRRLLLLREPRALLHSTHFLHDTLGVDIDIDINRVWLFGMIDDVLEKLGHSDDTPGNNGDLITVHGFYTSD
jgi:hypothetical protein